MLEKDKRSFFEKLTGTINVEEEEEYDTEEEMVKERKRAPIEEIEEEPADEPKIKEHEEETPELVPDEEVELAVDVYEDGEDIFVQAMIAGVKPEDIDVSITRDMITLRGKRVNPARIASENYFHKELYWGGFSRKILLPEEVDPETSEALERHGLLILRLPKFNKKQSQKLEVRSVE